MLVSRNGAERIRVDGQVDHVNDRVIRGWAWMPGSPETCLVLDVFHRSVFLGQVVAGTYRADLERHGIGGGRHGFIFHLPDDVPQTYHATDLTIATAAPDRQTIAMAMGLAPENRRSRRLSSSDRHHLAPYLAALRLDMGAAPKMASVDRRPRIDVLCSREPEAGLSAFLVHIARKYDRSVAKADQPAFLCWYMESYAMEQGPKRAPLSRDDIARLVEGQPTSIIAGMTSFAVDAATPNHTYRWAAEVSCRLFAEDFLVTDEQKAKLQSLPSSQQAISYPLSCFMQSFYEKNVIFHQLEMDRERDRQAIYVLFMVFALRRLSMLSYMPAVWLARMLADEAATDGALRRLYDDPPPLTAKALEISLARAGITTDSPTWKPDLYRGNRVPGGSSIMTGPAEYDVQIIGPFRRAMGLGESCRRVARALLATSLSVNLVDYPIGSGDSDAVADLSLGHMRPSRLNILHLNLDEVPEALAYLPDAFSGTPTVAIPYWELDRPAAVHRLGLAVIDEVWAASRFMAEVFAGAGPPVHWIGMSCSQTPAVHRHRRDELRRRYGIQPATFLFLTNSDAVSGIHRKNPIGVIRAFQAAFDADDVALIVKTRNVEAVLPQEQRRQWLEVEELCKSDPRIVFISDTFDHDTQRTLLAAADCYVTLHRAEGLGLDALDALGMGVPVVATDYSGVTDFCTPETAWMVEAERVAVDPREYCFVESGHLWAAPSQADAVSAIRSVYTDRQRRWQKVEVARDLISRTATVEAFARRLEHRIRLCLERNSSEQPK